MEVAGSKEEKGQIEREEEQEECDRRLQRAEQEDESEDKPALLRVRQTWNLKLRRDKSTKRTMR